MTDRYDHDLLLAYLEGDLAPGDRARVDAMLADDPKLASLMRDMAGDRDLLRSMPSEPAPGDLSFDLVQGLERRMLLDAPQVEPSGPIPISRGRRPGGGGGGVRWSRVGGVLGMAAALGLATGLVLYFNMADPLMRTAFEMNDQPTADAPASNENDLGSGEPGRAESLAMESDTGGGAAAPAGPGLGRNTPEVSDANLAERAREAILSGGQPPESADADPETRTHVPPPTALAEGLAAAPGGIGVAESAGEPLLALTAYAPDRALRIASDNPDLSRAQVVNWAVNNGIPVVQPDPEPGGRAAAPPQEQLALLIEEDQLDSLIEVVNEVQIAPAWNQRAEIGVVDEGDYGDVQQFAGDAPGAGEALADAAGPQPEAEADDALDQAQPGQTPEQLRGQGVVSLKVPDDLGDEFLNRQNVANTFLYTNQDELALTAQRDAEVVRNRQQQALQADQATGGRGPGAAGAPGTERRHGGRNVNPQAPTDRAGGRDEIGNAAPGGGEAPEGDGATQPEPGDLETQRPTDPRAAVEPAESQQADEEAQSTPGRQGADMREPAANSVEGEGQSGVNGPPAAEENQDPAAPRQPAPRGNWLMPQMPLADSAPIVTDPPKARLVPIVFVFQPHRPGPADAARLDTTPDAEPAESEDESAAEGGAESEPAPEAEPAQDESSPSQPGTPAGE